MKSLWETMFSDGVLYAQNQLYHAALDIWSKLLDIPVDDPEDTSRVYDEIGKVHIQLGNIREALKNFVSALQYTQVKADVAKVKMHIGMTYFRLHEYDKGQRMMKEALGLFEDKEPSRPLILLLINFAVIQGANQFHAESLKTLKQALDYAIRINLREMFPYIYNNLGVAYLELGYVKQAEEHLLKAIQESSHAQISALSELSRVYMIQSNYELSMFYAEEAVKSAWSSVINYTKKDMAWLGQVLAHVAYEQGEKDIAIKLLAKAQIMFGQVGMWREWGLAQTTMDEWAEVQKSRHGIVSSIQIEKIYEFLMLVDIMNAQELIGEEFSTLIDTRVLYGRAIAERLALPDDKVQSLIYASRFADYGMTALEPECQENPKRSPQSWQQYQQHPILSVKMLDYFHFDPDVLEAIAEHHENFDGGGYPYGKGGEELNILSQILSISDFYAHRVILDKKPHSEILAEIKENENRLFAADIANTFIGMFDSSVSSDVPVPSAS